MTIENDLTRIAAALESIASCMLARPFGVEPLLAPTPEPDDEEATYVASTPTAAPTPAPIPAPEPPAAPARVRRTKAQIEADKQAEAQRILAALQAQGALAAASVVTTPAPAQTFTLADFRPRFVKLADAGKRDDLIALIGTLGGKMLTDIKPDQYPALHDGLVKLEGGHG